MRENSRRTKPAKANTQPFRLNLMERSISISREITKKKSTRLHLMVGILTINIVFFIWMRNSCSDSRKKCSRCFGGPRVVFQLEVRPSVRQSKANASNNPSQSHATNDNASEVSHNQVATRFTTVRSNEYFYWNFRKRN